jgi:uncharacterized protein
MKKQILVGGNSIYSLNISGGTGVIGTPLVNLLSSKGHKVIVLTRNKNKQSTGNIEYLNWDKLEQKQNDFQINACVNLTGRGIMDKEWKPDCKKG